MPYGDPQSNVSGGTATVAVQDLSGAEEYPAQIELTSGQFGSGEASLEAVEALFQKILTAIEAHPDLHVVNALRIYDTSQPVTP